MTMPLTSIRPLRLVDELRETQLPPPARRREIRRAAGASLQQVAEELGVSIATVASWETGTRRPWRKHRGPYRHLLAALESLATESGTSQT